jgi:isopenicillin N synthase-like dioxygenase
VYGSTRYQICPELPVSAIEKAASEIRRVGYTVMPMTEALNCAFSRLPAAFADVPRKAKETFSFPDRLDGFQPFGEEHSENSPDQPDLCERFCYFRRFQAEHRRHELHASEFYRAVDDFEAAASQLSAEVLEALFDQLGGSPPQAPGEDSYIQICRYGAEYAALGKARDFLQDPHIDGQLLTLIAQTDPGLLVGERADLEPVPFGRSEVFIMAGKLLELATDGEIGAVLHGVARSAAKRDRISVIYFQNPAFDVAPFQSLRTGTPLDLAQIAETIHQSYGLPAYRAAGK